jgi:hypothetical protein
MKAPSTFQTANYAVNLDSCGDIHYALGSPFFHLKIEEIEAFFLTPLRNLQRRAAFIAPFTSEESKNVYSAFGHCK